MLVKDHHGVTVDSPMMIAKNPTTCRTKSSPSTRGSFLARAVLKKMAKAVTAMTRSVPCHGLWPSSAYCSLFRAMSPWMIVPHKKVMEQIAACHPVKQSQPTIYDRNRWQLGGDHSETQWY
jgi:hypothetical protein